MQIFKLNFFYIAILFISIFKISTAYFIPFSILPNSPHDDFLFFNLGTYISEFKWLGPYNNFTLIKGPVFPIFIGSSIMFQIPLRIFEALLIVSASFYFMLFLKKINLNNYVLLIFFAVLIFFPFQYTSVEFRILRQIIYPWIILIIFTSLINIVFIVLRDNVSKINKKLVLHICILSLSIFTFHFTREEGIWLFPFLFLFILLIFYLFYKAHKTKLFIKILFISTLIFLLLTSLLKAFNYIAYETTTINEFKNSDYVYGYSSLFLFGEDDDTFYAPTKSSWEKMFLISPAAEELSKYIYSDAYKGWTATGCNGLRNGHHRTLKTLDCDDRMVSAFFLWAIRDAIWEAGYRTPSDVFKFMRRLGDELHNACNLKYIGCKKVYQVMTPQYTFDFKRYENLLENFKLAFSLSRESNRSNDAISHPPELKIYEIAQKINANAFRPIQENLDIPENFKFTDYIHGEKKPGFVDYVLYEGNKIILSGWVFDGQPYEKIIAVINGIKYCEVTPNGQRKDITDKFNVGFQCSFKYDVIPGKKIDLDVYAAKGKNLFLLNKIKVVDSKLLNIFDEKCYVEENIDVKDSISKNLFSSGYEHYIKYGYKENRICTPLVDEIHNIKLDDSIYTPAEKNLGLKVNKIFIFIYSHLDKLSPYIIIFGLIFLSYKNLYLELLIAGGLLSIFILRLVLMAIMETLYFAPLAPVYLLTATFFYYLSSLTILFMVISNIHKK